MANHVRSHEAFFPFKEGAPAPAERPHHESLKVGHTEKAEPRLCFSHRETLPKKRPPEAT
jgi:hypothetical protein